MPIEMVGGDVQNHRDPRTEFHNRFQLKTRYLQHGPGRWPSLIDKTDSWRADIAAHQCREFPSSNNLAGQRSASGLAISAGNGDDWPRQELRRQFNLADHRLPQVASLHQLRRVDRHTRADHNQILPAKGAVT